MQLIYQYFSFESVHDEAILKTWWVVKKLIFFFFFFFWTALYWSKCIQMVSLYIVLSIYTNNEILCIIWKFDRSSRGVLGRIYALSIEVLSARGQGIRTMTNIVSKHNKIRKFLLSERKSKKYFLLKKSRLHHALFGNTYSANENKCLEILAVYNTTNNS